MQNPWVDLPKTAPFVLPCDKQAIDGCNRRASISQRIHLEVLPEPYAGNPETKIMLLNGNPGFYERNETFLVGDEYFVQASEANRLHRKQDYPFYHLDPRLSTSAGYYWWSRKLRPLIDLYGAKKVANELCVVEYFPYHSVKFGCTTFVPSQAYSWYLVKEGLKRNAIIVIMRSKNLWYKAVPELEEYPHSYIVRNPQNPTISAPNCPQVFPEILRVLAHASLRM